MGFNSGFKGLMKTVCGVEFLKVYGYSYETDMHYTNLLLSLS